MVDFRKWLIAFASAALLFGLGSSAFAQSATAFICNATAGNPHIVRSEGVAELVGDLVLDCTGGTFTPAGQTIPPSNVQISLNTNVTSRLTGSGPGNPDSEAILSIDEPYPDNGGTQAPFPLTTPRTDLTTGAATTQLGCVANGTAPCLHVTSLGWGFGAGVVGQPACTTGSYNGCTGHPNVFQGIVNAAIPNQVNWQGVPIDAPGTTATRVIRITNVRANACMLGVGSTLVPTTITELIGVSGSQTIIINNPLQTVALAEKGLYSSVNAPFGPPIYPQCNTLNEFLIDGAPGLTASAISLSATEGFAAAFKPVVAFSSSAGVYVQNIFGVSYNTESGYVPLNVLGLDQGNTKIGLADTGTEISFTLTGVGAGVNLFAPASVALVGPDGVATGGFAYLVGTLTGGIGASFNPPAPSGNPVPVTVTGTTASVTYEITSADPNVVETLNLPLSVAFINSSSTVPFAGVSSVAINYAPLSTSTQSSSSTSAPIPRFCQPYGPGTSFTISPCTCNLLFPFITNQAGFDTGVAIANTSADPYGTVPQTGAVTLWYYGNTSGGGAAPGMATSQPIPAGQELVFLLSSGGNFGITATPNFQGYMIAQAAFQFCHGFAFISDLGAQKLAEGYLAISLDAPSWSTVVSGFSGPTTLRGSPTGTTSPPGVGEDNAH
jgi:hypothetical protein